jgi:hypothetical protein
VTRAAPSDDGRLDAGSTADAGSADDARTTADAGSAEDARTTADAGSTGDVAGVRALRAEPEPDWADAIRRGRRNRAERLRTVFAAFDEEEATGVPVDERRERPRP